MPLEGYEAKVWVGKNNPETQAAAARLHQEIRGKTIIRVEGHGDQVIFYFHDNSSLALNCEGGFKEVS